MKDQIINEHESLAIIQQMIDKSKERIVDNSLYFYMWGFAVSICAITQYILLKMLFTRTQYVWLLMPFMAIVHVWIAIKREKTALRKTHHDFAIQSVWMALGIAFFIIVGLSFQVSFNLFSFLILLYGIGTFTTGSIIQFTPLIMGGCVCFILCVLINFIDGPEQLLILALSVIAAYIIPAYLLQQDFKKHISTAK